MTTAPSAATPRVYEPRAIWGWALYDFANSAFTTLIVTFIYAVVFQEVIVGDTNRGTELWSRAISITAVLVAVGSPFLGALADRGGYRRRFLIASTVVTIVGVAFLTVPGPGQVVLAMTVFIVSNVAYELCGVFYNSYLPEIAPPNVIGRVSGYGWALGYVGGLLAMAVALFGLIGGGAIGGLVPDGGLLGVPTEGSLNGRAVGVLVAVWFAVFSVPMFLWVREPPAPRAAPAAGAVARAAWAQLATTFHEVRRYRQIAWLLLARLLYNDGLVTIFTMGALYATGTFGFSLSEVTLWGLALNVTAGAGAFAMGFLDDRIGGKKTILISIVGLCLSTLFGVVTQTKAGLWIAGLAIGVFMGPNQAASRSLLGRFVPPEKETEFYGFFAFSGKAISFLGPMAFGTLTAMTGSQRAGAASVLIFFVLGGLLLLRVDEAEGMRMAHEGSG